jgi:hypothetical protein
MRRDQACGCVPLQEQCTAHLNNNTPVNTEVLLGGGLLLARPPSTDHGEQVVDTDDSIAVDITSRDR